MHKVKCAICGRTFDRDKEPFVLVSSRRYAHQACSLGDTEKVIQEEKDKEALNEYIKKLFNTDYVDPRIQKQITQYREQYNYTYSGIQKALTYFYEIKGNDLAKSNGGIGIVPYIYKNSYDYYYALWLANQKNEDKSIEEYKPKIKEIIIENPERKVKKRSLFSFLDMGDGYGV